MSGSRGLRSSAWFAAQTALILAAAAARAGEGTATLAAGARVVGDLGPGDLQVFKVDLQSGDTYSFAASQTIGSRVLLHVSFLDPTGREINRAAKVVHRADGARVTIGPWRAPATGTYEIDLAADAWEGGYVASSALRAAGNRTYRFGGAKKSVDVSARRGQVISLTSTSRASGVLVLSPGQTGSPTLPDAATLSALFGGGLSVGTSGTYRFVANGPGAVSVRVSNPAKRAFAAPTLPRLPEDGSELGDSWYWNDGWRPAVSDTPPLARAIIASVGQGKPLSLDGLDVAPAPDPGSPAAPPPPSTTPTPVPDPPVSVLPDHVAVDLNDVVLDPRAADPRWAAWNYDGLGRGFLVFFAYDFGLANGQGFASSRWFWAGSGIDQPRAPRGGGLPPYGIPEAWQLTSRFVRSDGATGPTYTLTLVGNDSGPVTGRYVMTAQFFIDGRAAPAPVPGTPRIDEYEIRWTDEGSGQAFGVAWTQSGSWSVRGQRQLPRSAAAYTNETSYLFTNSEVLDGGETYVCGDVTATSSAAGFTAYQMECAPYSYQGAITSSVASASLGLDESVTRTLDPRLYMGRMFNPMSVSGRRGGADFDPYSLLVSAYWATTAVDPGDDAAARENAVRSAAWAGSSTGAMTPTLRLSLFTVDGLRLSLEGLQ